MSFYWVALERGMWHGYFYFPKIKYCVCTDREVEAVRTFCERGEGVQFFVILCGRLL